MGIAVTIAYHSQAVSEYFGQQLKQVMLQRKS